MFVLQIFLRNLFFYWHFYYCYFVCFLCSPIFFYAFAIKICHEVGEYYKVVEPFKSFFLELYIFSCFVRAFVFLFLQALRWIQFFLSLIIDFSLLFSFANHFHCNFFWFVTPFYLLCFFCVQVLKMVYVDVQFFCLQRGDVV
jgi:hypothetical protein